MTPNLYGRLLHLLNARSVVPLPDDVRLVEEPDGIGPRIAAWNTSRLGAQPTPAEIAAVTDAQAAAALKTQKVDAEAMRDLVKGALLYYLRDKLGRNPTPAERQAELAAVRQALQDAM